MSSLMVFCASMFEILTIYLFIVLLDKRNRLSPIKVACFVLFNSALSTALNYFSVQYHLFFMFLSYLLLLWGLTRLKILNLTVDIIMANAIYFVMQFIATVVIGNLYGNIFDNYLLLFSMLGLFLMVPFCLGRSKNIQLLAKKFYVTNRDIIFWIAANVFVVLLLISNILVHYIKFFWQEQGLFIVLIALNYMLNIILLFNFLRRKKLKSETKTYQDYSAYLESMMDQLSREQHEYNNQITAILGVTQTAEPAEMADMVTEYCRNVLEDKRHAEHNILICNDSMVAALLFKKTEAAEEKDIHFKHDIETPFPQYPLSSYDVIELLSNLINNAFEAVEVLEEGRRNVTLRMISEKIEISNEVSSDFSAEAISRFQRPGYSTKGRNRGHGLINITSIVQRYGGALEIYMRDSQVVFEIKFMK